MSAAATPAPKSLRILCVDDEEAVRSTLCHFLRRRGLACEAVPGGPEALQAIATDQIGFDLVLTDHNMPGLDGLELVESLHARGFPGRILVHASPLDTSRRSAYERLRVDGIIEKPALPATLLQTILNLVEPVPSTASEN